MKHRAEIEWLANDTRAKVGCLRIGGPDFSHRCYDDFCRAATVVLDEKSGVIEVKGWDDASHQHWLVRLLMWCLGLIGYREEGITPSQWEATEVCFLREGIRRYCFSRAKGPWRRKKLHWCRRQWDEKRNEWTKDTDERSVNQQSNCPTLAGKRSGVIEMSVKVTKEVTTDTGFSHKEETIYSDRVTPAELAVITALEVGDAANRTAMADLAVKRLQSTEQG